MTYVYAYNLFECGLWLVIAGVVSTAPQFRRLPIAGRVMLIVSLVLMSGTEAWESQTGAWWRPWWLAVIKGSCIAGVIGGFWMCSRK